jgi:hypothetical protein
MATSLIGRVLRVGTVGKNMCFVVVDQVQWLDCVRADPPPLVIETSFDSSIVAGGGESGKRVLLQVCKLNRGDTLKISSCVDPNGSTNHRGLPKLRAVDLLEIEECAQELAEDHPVRPLVQLLLCSNNFSSIANIPLISAPDTPFLYSGCGGSGSQRRSSFILDECIS